MAETKNSVTVQLPAKTQKKLEQVACSLSRSRNWLINEAIENYLDVYEWQEKKIRGRLEKAEQGGKFISSSDIHEAVETFKP